MFLVLHVMMRHVLVVFEVPEYSATCDAAFKTVFTATTVPSQSTAKIVPSTVAQTGVMIF
jgi:hypothetical protein